jgi:hypothetical protein
VIVGLPDASWESTSAQSLTGSYSETAVAELIDQVSRSVVVVEAIDAQGLASAQGSGVVIDWKDMPDAAQLDPLRLAIDFAAERHLSPLITVVTNRHVIQKAE